MTTITTPHIDAKNDGDPFEQGINTDFYSGTSGQGIMSEGNGGMELLNLDTTFEMQSEHVLEGQMGNGWSYGEVRKIDYCSDIFSDDETDPTVAPHIVVWQMAVRQYIPYNVSFVIWDLTCFRAVFKYLSIEVADMAFSDRYQFALATRMAVDGVEIPHTRTEHPDTAWTTDNWPPLATDKGVLKSPGERPTAAWQHVTHMQEDVSAGWHECTLELYMESTKGTVSGTTGVAGTGNYFTATKYTDITEAEQTTDVAVYVHNRITFGPRAGNTFWML